MKPNFRKEIQIKEAAVYKPRTEATTVESVEKGAAFTIGK
jgi:hypothetical protein